LKGRVTARRKGKLKGCGSSILNSERNARVGGGGWTGDELIATKHKVYVCGTYGKGEGGDCRYIWVDGGGKVAICDAGNLAIEGRQTQTTSEGKKRKRWEEIPPRT